VVKRALVMAAVLFLGCNPPNQKACNADPECGVGGKCLGNLCYFDDVNDGGTGGGGMGGGVGGGTGIGGGGEMGGGGGGVVPLASLHFDFPLDGLRTAVGGLDLRVTAAPPSADPGVVKYYASVSGVAGPMGTLSSDGGNVFTTSLNPIAEGAWHVDAVAGDVDASVDFTVDRTGPTLWVEVPMSAPDYGPTTSEFIPTEDGGGWYRKDEVVSVTVRSSDTDVDVSSLKLKAQFGGSATTTLQSPSICDAGCWKFSLDLSQIEMPAFRGDVVLSPVGSDMLANTLHASDAGVLHVTRWQWAKKIGQGGAAKYLTATPAVGNGGRLFIGIAANNTGIAAIDPDGGNAWTPVSDDAVVGPVAAGRGSAGREHVFFQPSSTTSTGTLKSLDAKTGTNGMQDMQVCAGGGGTANEGGVALFAENSAAVASIGVQADSSNSRGRVLIPESQNCSSTTTATGLQKVSAPGNLVTAPPLAAMAGSNGHLRLFSYDATAQSLALVSTVDQAVGAIGTVNGLGMLSATRVVGAGGGGPGVGGLFAFDVDAGTSVVNAWPTATALATPTSGPAVGASGVYASIRTGNGKVGLVRVRAADGVAQAQSAELSTSSFMGTEVPTPVLGANGRAYVVDENGSLYVLPSAFAPDAGADWETKLPGVVGGTVSASPTLDCDRRMPNSHSGVLYIATESGWLVSYLVDSTGLDPTAPWPKYARDSRNTGSFDGGVIGCP
jgi:hypothetical protein